MRNTCAAKQDASTERGCFGAHGVNVTRKLGMRPDSTAIQIRTAAHGRGYRHEHLPEPGLLGTGERAVTGRAVTGRALNLG